jgi:threonine dehydrogenase-like Zn-dependent dehydrogenase
MSMRAVVVRGPGDYGVEEVPEPDYGDYEALVRISHCGICTGTDLHIVAGTFPWAAPYPTILGHESIGTVIACGRKVRHLREGDLVLRPSAKPKGAFSVTYGGMAELGVVTDVQSLLEDTPGGKRGPAGMALSQQVVPADFDREAVGIFITFKETLSWAQDFGIGPGARVAILGTGGVGLCFVRVCKLLGAELVIACGRRETALARARQMGADVALNVQEVDLRSAIRQATAGLGCTHAVEAVGDNELLQECLALICPGGRVGQYGVPAERRASLDWSLAPHAFSLHFISPQEHRVHRQALEWVRLGFFSPRSLLDAVLPMSAVREAFALLESKQAIRVALSIG